MVEEWRATPVSEGRSGEQTVEVPGRPGEFAGVSTLRYKTSFRDPREPDEEIALLELRGLYASAKLELTGDRLGGDWPVSHDTYFKPLVVPFRPYEENELTVTCQKPQDRFGGLYETDLVPAEQAVPGIWWDVSLQGRSLPTIAQIDLSPELDGELARLSVEATVITDGPLTEKLTYSLRPEGDGNTRGMMERKQIETEQAGLTTIQHTVEMREPARWWPRELGRQRRYTLSVKFAGEERTVTTGFCTVSRDGGQLLINDEPLNIRGVNLLTTGTDAVERALDLNANLIRARAHVLPERIYEQCDREGLLVWQDLPLTGPGSFDTTRGKELASTLSGYCRSHPSVTVYSVQDSPTEGVFAGLGSGLLDRLRFRYRAWRTGYSQQAAETVTEAFPRDRPVVPAVGEPGVGGSVVSAYPGWEYGKPEDIEWLLERYPTAIVAAYGAGSLVTDETTGAAGFDEQFHDRCVGPGSSSQDSQAYQASLLQTITETLRREQVGAIACALRDTDTAGMGVYTRDGQPKASKETLERSFAPLQAFAVDPTPGSTEILVVNDTPTEYAPTVEWDCGQESGSLDFEVESLSQATGGPVTVPDTAPKLSLVVRVNDHKITNKYDL